jgi:hypothetical protein
MSSAPDRIMSATAVGFGVCLAYEIVSGDLMGAAMILLVSLVLLRE